MRAASAVAADTEFYVDGAAASPRQWHFHERLLTTADGSEYCASIAFKGRDGGEELRVREIVDVEKELIRECEEPMEEEEEENGEDDAAIFRAMLAKKPF